MAVVIVLLAILAGVVQGVTGFGAGIVLMMGLPYFFPLLQCAGISTAICALLSGTMVYTYRAHINFKKIIGPAVLYIAICTTTIQLSTSFNPAIVKKVFGVFLTLLAIYYLFINKSNERQKFSLPVSLAFIMVSAICDGLFGIGGPLMVLYFMSQTHNTHEYLGTIQCFFFINSIYNTILRIFKGILTIQFLPSIALGWVAIFMGGLLARTLVSKLDGNLVRKLTYIMIGISGIINLL